MSTSPLLVYDSALFGMLGQSLPSPVTAPITAVLLSPKHTADLTAHTRLADIAADEIRSADYERQDIDGARVTAVADGACFHTDAIHFGDPVTIGPVRYLAIVCGPATGLTGDSPLLGIAALSVGSAIEAQRSHFIVSAPEDGWFKLSRSQ